MFRCVVCLQLVVIMPDSEHNGDCIVPASPVFFVPVDLTSLPTIPAQVRQWLSENRPSDAPDSEEPLEIPEVGDLEAYAANFEGDGNWDFSDLTGGLDFASQAFSRDDYDQLEKCVRLPAFLFPLFCVSYSYGCPDSTRVI